MKIEQILIQPIGTKINPGAHTIKTAKKKWQVKDIWWQQVVLMDGTGEIPADVKIGKKYVPLNGTGSINIIVAEVQNAEYLNKDRKKLVVDQFTIPTTSMAEYEQEQDQLEDELKLIVQGKIRHGLVCVARRDLGFKGPLSQMHKECIRSDVKFIMTGE